MNNNMNNGNFEIMISLGFKFGDYNLLQYFTLRKTKKYNSNDFVLSFCACNAYITLHLICTKHSM